VTKLGVGIVGASADSGWARFSHIPAIAASPHLELTAVATTNRESALKAASAFKVPRAFVGAAALAACEAVDLVVISIKAPEHEAAVTAAVAAGKPVLCEWPLGANCEGAARMTTLARSRRLRGVIGLQGRFSPVAMQARQLIDSGYLGEIQAVTLRASYSFWGRYLPAAYFADERSGVNVLSISGGHCLDMMTYLCGEVTQVSGALSYRHKEGLAADTQTSVVISAPDQFAAQGRLSNGAIFAVHVIGDAPSEQTFRLRITGTKGQIELEAPGMPEIAPLTLTGSQSEKPMTMLASAARGADDPETAYSPVANYLALYQTFAIGWDGLPTFDEALKLHELLDAIHLSSRTGTRQAV
jgi:predicted dehydrogenase